MFLVELQHLESQGQPFPQLSQDGNPQSYPLRTRLVTGRNLGFRPVEPAVVVFLVPDQIGPQFSVVIFFDGVDGLHHWVPGVLVRRRGFPVVVADGGEADGRLGGLVEA